MSNSVFDQQIPAQPETNRNAIALRYGLMTGFIGMFLSTINNLYLLKSNYVLFIISSLLVSAFIVPVTFYSISVKRQRDLLGGFISIKEAFRVVFIVVLISVLISAVYGVIYVKWIDPEYVERMKESTYAFMERQHVPQETIDAKMTEFDENLAKSTRPGNFLFSTASLIILQSIFGFIVAMIMKRDPGTAQS